MSRFAGKVALVTGAAQGIGRTIAERFAAEGAAVVIFDLNADQAAATAQSLGAQGYAVEAVGGDVAVRDDVCRGVETCVQKFGRLDVLVAHAGIADFQPLLEIDERSWRRIIDVNLTGVFLCTQEAGRVMARAGGGAIVVTASTNAFWVESNGAHYNASKGGVIAFVRSAALDLAPYHIRVNAVAPGVVRTPLAAWVTEDPANAAEYLKRIPLNRFAETLDVAQSVLFLASEEASYITGQHIILDGGQTLGITLPAPAEPLPGAVRAEGSA
ncbi:MAG TPA: glucose 1-dehydrogenase [Chloroflexota bacterium]|nr:glucose 1-dehydrogenase [Chloroflexota bacterium]